MNASGQTAPVDLVLDSTGPKLYGPGERERAKHGERHRAWRKFHLTVDAPTREIPVNELTEADASDWRCSLFGLSVILVR